MEWLGAAPKQTADVDVLAQEKFRQTLESLKDKLNSASRRRLVIHFTPWLKEFYFEGSAVDSVLGCSAGERGLIMPMAWREPWYSAHASFVFGSLIFIEKKTLPREAWGVLLASSC